MVSPLTTNPIQLVHIKCKAYLPLPLSISLCTVLPKSCPTGSHDQTICTQSRLLPGRYSHFFPAVLQKPGVAGYFGAKDVPGGNDMGAVVHDEECFASEVVTCIGQPIGVIVADTEQHARMAARLVQVEYEDLPALISIEDAIEAGSYYEVKLLLMYVAWHVTGRLAEGPC